MREKGQRRQKWRDCGLLHLVALSNDYIVAVEKKEKKKLKVKEKRRGDVV